MPKKERGKKVVATNRKRPARLHDRGHLRGRARADRHRGEVAARGPGVARRRLRLHRRRRGVARCRAHPRVHRGHLEQPRPATQAQAAAAQGADHQDQPQDQGGRLHARPAEDLLQRRHARRSRSRSPRASASTTSGRRCASGRTSARPTARSRRKRHLGE